MSKTQEVSSPKAGTGQGRLVAIIAAVVIILVVAGLLVYFLLLNRPASTSSGLSFERGTLPILAGDGDIHMLDDQNGWLANQPGSNDKSDWYLYHTSDGGKTWQQVMHLPSLIVNDSQWFPSGKQAAFFQAYSYNDNVKGLAPTGMVWWGTLDQLKSTTGQVKVDVYYTNDGGANWQKSTFTDGVPTGVAGFVDGQTGWLKGDIATDKLDPSDTSGKTKVLAPAIWQTTNGGQSWQKIFSGKVGSESLTPDSLNISFSSATNGVMIASTTGEKSGPYMYKTIDGGKNWEKLTIPASLSLTGDKDTGLRFFTDQEGILLTYTKLHNAPWGDVIPRDFYKTTINATHDGGKTWSLTGSVDSYIRAVDFADAQHVIYQPSTGLNALKSSSDGGKTWTDVTPKLPTKSLLILRQATATSAWAIGFSTGTADPTRFGTYSLLHTTDNGENWTQVADYAKKK